MSDFPLVLSMTQFQQYRRCRKSFEYSAIREYDPVKTSEAASAGSSLHKLLEHAAHNAGKLPASWEDPDMLAVAKEYLAKRPLPEGIISAEKGYFAEIAPNVFIRASFDLVYKDWQLVIRDYKSFAKAPSLDADFDNQAQDYLVVAEMALGTTDARFEWEYIRRELGRFLSGGKGKEAIWTPWPDEDRYIQQTLVLSDIERETIKRELYDCALDIQQTIENGRFYRTGLKSGPHGCEGCFYRGICRTEKQHGELTEQDLALLTNPYDPAARQDAGTIIMDPRVKHYEARGIATSDAVLAVYGPTGIQKIKESV